MPYQPLPYVAPQYDSSASDDRMADLRRYKSTAQITAAQRSADMRARTILGIGNQVSNSIGDLVKWREAAPARALAERRFADEVRQRDEAERYRALDQTLAGKEPEERAAALEAAGFRDQAEAARDKATARKMSAAQLHATELKNQTESVKMAGDLLESIAAQKTPEARRASYTAALPQLQQLVPHMKDSMPTPDLFDDDFLEVGRQWGKTEAEKLAERRERVLTDDAEARHAKSAVELQKAWEERLGSRLAKAQDATDWDTIRMDAGRSGAPQEVIDLFGEDFSPASQKRAGLIARGEKAPAGSTDDERALERFAARLGKSVADLTQDEENNFVKERTQLTRKGTGTGTGDGVTAATRRVAVAQRDAEHRELDDKVSMDPVERAKKHNALDLSYFNQVNEEPTAADLAKMDMRVLDAQEEANPSPDGGTYMAKKNAILRRHGLQSFDQNRNPNRPATPTAPTAPRAPTAPSATAPMPPVPPSASSMSPSYRPGQTVYFQGKPVIVGRVSPDGKRFWPR